MCLWFSVNDATLLDDHVDQDRNGTDRQQGEHEDNTRRGFWENVLLFHRTPCEVLLVDIHKHLLHNSVGVETRGNLGIIVHAVGQFTVMTARAERQIQISYLVAEGNVFR